MGGAKHARWAAAVVGVMALLATGGCWWDQPGAGPGQTYSNPSEGRLTLANVSTLDRVWSAWSGASAVVDGVVVGATGWPTAGANVAAWDLKTGEQLWSRTLGPSGSSGAVTHAPVVVHGEVWAGYQARTSETTCANGFVRLDLSTGTVVAEDPSFAPIEIVPAGDQVVMQPATFRPSPWFPGCDEFGVLPGRIVDAESGATEWEVNARLRQVTIAGSVILAADYSNLAQVGRGGCGAALCDPAYVTQPASGGALFHLAAEPGTPPVGVVNMNGEDTVTTIDPRSGQVVGSAPAPVGTHSLAVARGVAYVAGSTELAAYDIASCASGRCTRLWSSSPAATPSLSGALAVAGGVLYVGHEDGLVEAYDAAGCGASLCSPVVPEVFDRAGVTNLAVAGGHLVVGSTDEVAVLAPAG